MADFLGMTFGSYKLVAPLGQGGMGTVFRGYQEAIDRSVAIKLLPANLLSDPSFLTRFTEEARALSKLAHPAILPLYEYGQANGLPYIVMPIMSGGNFADRVKRGPLTLSEVVRVLTPIAAALDFAHQQNVIHRDVKPSNILFDHQDHALLADFGLAKIVEGEPDGEQEALSGTVSGTPAYMSPEQALGHKLDGRSDLYSLGVVAYEALVGRAPFSSRNVIQLAMKHVNEPPPKPRSLRADLSQAVEDSILKVLEKDRDARFATAGEFLQALSNAAYLSRDFWRPIHRLEHASEEAPAKTPDSPAAQSAEAPAPARQHENELPPMDQPTPMPDPYTQIAAPPGIDPYDVPDPTLVADPGELKTLAPDPESDDEQPPTLV